MLDDVKELLYSLDDGVMERLRNNSSRLTDDEKDTLRAFSKEVNQHLRENNANSEEICVALEIVHYFMYEPEWQAFATEITENLTAKIPY